MSRPIPSLDGLRAFSIIVVALSHAGLGYIVPGDFGVTVFFFLSGFLITTLLLGEIETKGSINLRAFYLRRLLRLSPPLIVTLLIVYTLFAMDLVTGEFSFAGLLSQVFYFQNYYMIFQNSPAKIPDGFNVLWSLAVEEHFYLIYPVFLGGVIFSGKIRGLYLMSAVLFAVLLWRIFLVHAFQIPGSHIYVATDTRIDSILWGCLLALLINHNLAARFFPNATLGIYLWFAASLAVLMLTNFWWNETFRSTIQYTLQGMALMPVFYYAVTKPNFWLFKPLNFGVVKKVGLYSYSIYLIHDVIINGLKERGVPEENIALIFSISFLLSFLYAAMIFRFVEMPIAKYRRKIVNH